MRRPSPALSPDARQPRVATLFREIRKHDAELTLRALEALLRRRMLLVDYHPEHPVVVDVTSRLDVLLDAAERDVAIDDSAHKVAERLSWMRQQLLDEQAAGRERYGPAHPHMQRVSVQLEVLEQLLPLVPAANAEMLDVADLWVTRDEVARLLADAERRYAARHGTVLRLQAEMEALDEALAGRQPTPEDCATLRRAYDLRLAHLRGQRDVLPLDASPDLDLRIDGLVLGRARTLAELSCRRDASTR